MTPSRPDTVIELIFPPSVNNLYRNTASGRKPAEHYSQWRRDAGWILAAQHPAPQAGRVTVLIELMAPDRKRRDADNGIKAILDLLVSHRIIDGDDWSCVREVTARWVEHGLPRATVTVRAAA